MAHQSLEKFARRLRRVEREVKHLGSAPRLAYSSVEGGTLDFHDSDGNLAISIGEQPDGTNAQVVASGPTPPTPAGVSGTPYFDGVVAKWDGTWEGGGVAPLDFARVEIHASTDPDFLPDLVGAPSGSLVASFSSPRGGAYSVSLEYGVDWYIKFIARSQTGAFSDPTVPALGPFQTEIIPGSRIAADFLDGKVVTGAILQTAADGQRMVLEDDGSAGVLQGWTGAGDEVVPAKINPALSGLSPTLSLTSGQLMSMPEAANVTLYSSTSGHSQVRLNAAEVRHGTDKVRFYKRTYVTDDHEPITVEGSLAFDDQLLQPGAARKRRSRSSGWNCPNTAWTMVPWDQLDIDEGNTIETTVPYSGGMFTLDPNGIYMVTACVRFASDNTGVRGARIVAGLSDVQSEDVRNAVGGVATSISLSSIISGESSVWVEAYQTSTGGTLSVTSSASNIFVHRIG